MVDDPPRREFAGQQPPGAAALKDVEEDGIEDLSRVVDLGRSPLVSGVQVRRLYVSELCVGKVGRVGHHAPKRKPSNPSFRIYQTVSPRTSVNRPKDAPNKEGRGAEQSPGRLLLLAPSLEKYLRHKVAAERLADEMEGDNDLGSMRFEPSFASHTGVVPRATGDGIDAPR
jgi:hypothetical protein